MQMLKIPRISNPKEIVEMIYTDMGDVPSEKSPSNGGFYRSLFKFDGKELHNDFYPSSDGNIMKQRFKSDTEFLNKHDLDLKREIFE